MIKYYILIASYTLISSIAALFLKRSSDNNKTFKQLLFFNFNLYFGLFLYVLASLGTIIALKYLEYSTVYFLSSATYIWSVFLGVIILKEELSRRKIMAITLILTGIALIIF